MTEKGKKYQNKEMKKSARHHYIPKFFIKGFTNKEGKIFVFEKKSNTLIETPKSPKQIFFEWDRNNAIIDDEKISLVEDFYAYTDSLLSTTVQKLRDSPNSLELHDEENIAKLIFFIGSLFWRIPLTDESYNEYFERITFLYENELEEITKGKRKGDDFFSSDIFKKLVRASLAHKFACNAFEDTTGKCFFAKIIEYKEDFFILGDFPIIYNRTPNTMTDIFNAEYYFPLSSKRLFVLSSRDGIDLTYEMIGKINMITLAQSQFHVCGPDISHLKRVVSAFQSLKENNLLSYLRSGLF